jgi:hypothetical protein
MKQYRISLIVFMLISMLACVIPGLEAPTFVPADPNTLSTIVVSTANAAASQTAVAQPLATGVPAETSDSQMKGATLEKLKEGTTKYNNYDGGFEVTIPAGWLAVRPNSDEFNAALVEASAHNTILRDEMRNDMAGYEANFDRLYSYALRPDLGKNAVFGISKLDWDPKDALPLDNTTMGELVTGLESSTGIPGFRADTAQLRENDNAVMTIEVGGHFAMSDGKGGTVPFYVTVVFFKPTSNSTARITFTIMLDYKAQISADVRSIIESIKVNVPQP